MARLFRAATAHFDGGVTLLPPESRVGLRQNFPRSAANGFGIKNRSQGNSAAFCAAGIVDHTWKVEPGDGRNDSDGLFSSDGL